MKSLLKNDFLFLKKTSKIVIFPVLLIIFSILSILMTKYSAEIIGYLIADASQISDLIDTSIEGAYTSLLGDLNEVILIVVIIVGVGMFIRDKTKGIMPLILSKPINRKKYLLSKYITFNLLILVSLLLGYIAFSYYASILFDGAYWVKGLIAILLNYVYFMFVLSTGLLFSALFRSYILALVSVFGIYIIFLVLGMFYDVGIITYLPGSLLPHSILVINDLEVVKDVVLNVITTLLITITFITSALFVFDKQDI